MSLMTGTPYKQPQFGRSSTYCMSTNTFIKKALQNKFTNAKGESLDSPTASEWNQSYSFTPITVETPERAEP